MGDGLLAKLNELKANAAKADTPEKKALLEKWIRNIEGIMAETLEKGTGNPTKN